MSSSSPAPMSDIELANSPCNPDDSPFHDLVCGHRIRTAYPEGCSPNCESPASVGSYNFLCPACLVDHVQTEMQLAALCMTATPTPKTDEDKKARDASLHAMVEKRIGEMRYEGDNGYQGHWRFCDAVEKLDPMLQFFDSFPEMHDEEVKTEVHQPPPTAQSKTRTDSVQLEDEATKAVREVLEKLALKENA